MDQIDTDSFKEASAASYDWYKEQLVSSGLSEEDAAALIAAFQK